LCIIFNNDLRNVLSVFLVLFCNDLDHLSGQFGRYGSAVAAMGREPMVMEEPGEPVLLFEEAMTTTFFSGRKSNHWPVRCLLDFIGRKAVWA
jgi:hypothetical protein